jgi:hypothetical protein
MPNHVEVAIGDGIEGAGVKRNAGHETVLPRPARTRKLISVKRRGANHNPLYFFGH